MVVPLIVRRPSQITFSTESDRICTAAQEHFGPTGGGGGGRDRPAHVQSGRPVREEGDLAVSCVQDGSTGAPTVRGRPKP